MVITLKMEYLTLYRSGVANCIKIAPSYYLKSISIIAKLFGILWLTLIEMQRCNTLKMEYITLNRSGRRPQSIDSVTGGSISMTNEDYLVLIGSDNVVRSEAIRMFFNPVSRRTH